MIYVHIPFCKSRCLYCDFFSSTLHSLKQEYLFSLREEISARSEEIKRARVNSIYIGGGTPSQLPVEYLHSIFHSIEQVTPIEEGAEVTIEDLEVYIPEDNSKNGPLVEIAHRIGCELYGEENSVYFPPTSKL